MNHHTHLLDALLRRCTFATGATEVACAFSGGADSTALVALARHAGLTVAAHHVDHGLRRESAAEADQAEAIAERLGATFNLHRVDVAPGSNLEARARAARLAALPHDAVTGHTADDQAETVLLRLMRGSGIDGLVGIRPGPLHPILGLRRAETEALCTALGIDPVHDRSNDSDLHARNRVRHELLPLMSQIAHRDVVPLLVRTAGLLLDDAEALAQLAGGLDPTDAKALHAASPSLARRALRELLQHDGYPPDAATVERARAVAAGAAKACELPGGRRLSRSRQRIQITDIGG